MSGPFSGATNTPLKRIDFAIAFGVGANQPKGIGFAEMRSRRRFVAQWWLMPHFHCTNGVEDRFRHKALGDGRLLCASLTQPLMTPP